MAGVLASGPGCVMSRGARTTSIAAGLGIAATGVLVGSAADTDAEHDGRGGGMLLGDLLGGVMVAAGVVAFVAGVAAREPAPAPPAPREWAWVGPPSLTPPAAAPHLPTRAASDDVLRLARQVRSLVAHRACGAVDALVARIAAADPAYAAELRLTMPCPPPAPARAAP